MHVFIVSIRDRNELDSSRAQVRDGVDDIGSAKGNVLHTRAIVKINIFFDLALLLPHGRFIDGHFDDAVGGTHDDALQSGVFGANVVVVDGPETVESEALFVKVAGRVHRVPVLVADAVVDGGEANWGEVGVGGFGEGDASIAGEKGAAAGVGGSLDEGVGGVAVCSDGCEKHGAFIVRAFDTGR